MFSSLSEASWLADQAAPGPGYLGTVSDTRPFLDGEDFRAVGAHTHTHTDACMNKQTHTHTNILITGCLMCNVDMLSLFFCLRRTGLSKIFQYQLKD